MMSKRAIGAANRLAFFDFVGGEVGGSDQASALLDGGGQFAGQGAVIEVVGFLAMRSSVRASSGCLSSSPGR